MSSNWQGQQWNDGTDWSPNQPSGFTPNPTAQPGPSFDEPGPSYPGEPYAPYQPSPSSPTPYAASPLGGAVGYPNLSGTISPFGPAHEYASYGQRVLATLIDSGGLLAGYLIGMVMMSVAGGSTSGENAASMVMLVLVLVGYGWFVYSRYIYGGSTGQSYGRKVAGIRLLSVDTNQPIGGGMTFLRDLAHNLDTWACYLGWLWPLWDQKHQTLADKVMSTHVVVDRGMPPTPAQPW